MVITIGEDITTKPIEVNIHSTGVAQEEQMFFTDDETEQEIRERKQRAKENPTIKNPHLQSKPFLLILSLHTQK